MSYAGPIKEPDTVRQGKAGDNLDQVEAALDFCYNAAMDGASYLEKIVEGKPNPEAESAGDAAAIVALCKDGWVKPKT